MPRHPPIALKTLDHSHCQCPSLAIQRIAQDGLGRKDQLLEICSMAAVRLTNHLRGIERPLRRTALINTRILLNTLMERSLQIQIPMAEPEQIFSSQCHTEQADRSKRAANLFSS